ncbi:MAG: hypothetical protein CMG66_00670 [Candidatus Marinimicrobia bacterium]|nr:hypothetical protein [Candidatus Neomarinimicrobiota bacterium]|tara:strand:+ start:16388 stop:16927 length:540 start_codon:yes stop_codon:yes gene_type:complete
MENNFYLNNLSDDIKYILVSFLITLAIGITTGMLYLYYTTNANTLGVIEHYKGSTNLSYEGDLDDFLDKPPKTKKYLHDMLETTHTHVIAFSVISILIGLIFYFNSIIKGKLKLFLIIEPFISTIITFSSLWIMRYFNDSFVYLTIASAILLYPCWYIMIFISIYELCFKKEIDKNKNF